MTDIPETMWCVFQGDAIVVTRSGGTELALVTVDRKLLPAILGLAQSASNAVRTPLTVVEFDYCRVTQVIEPEAS